RALRRCALRGRVADVAAPQAVVARRAGAHAASRRFRAAAARGERAALASAPVAVAAPGRGGAAVGGVSRPRVREAPHDARRAGCAFHARAGATAGLEPAHRGERAALAHPLRPVAGALPLLAVAAVTRTLSRRLWPSSTGTRPSTGS